MKYWGERLQDLCKKERKVATDKVIGDKDSKLPNPKREIPMPKFEFENLLIVDVNVHSTPSNVVGYEIDYIINGIAKKELLWLEGYKTKEELEESIIKHERGNKDSKLVNAQELTKSALLIEILSIIEEHHFPASTIDYKVKYVLNGEVKERLLWADGKKTKEELQKSLIERETSERLKKLSEAVDRYIINAYANDEKSDKQSNTDLLKQLLDNPRVESIIINHERVGEVEHTEIEAKLKEGEGK